MNELSHTFDGLFKSQFTINQAIGRSVTYVRRGKLLGGNSGFAHIGTYHIDGDSIRVDVTSRRHNFGAAHQSLLGSDVSSISVIGRAVADAFHFEGHSPQVPGAVFRSVMTPLDEGDLPPPGVVGEGGISDGLYSIHLKILDGIQGGLTGVMLLNEGRILGGDAFFYYLGSYSSSYGRWRGHMVNQEHTPARGEDPVFGGHEIGIGFAGTCDGKRGMLEGTAFMGKRSIRFEARLELIALLSEPLEPVGL
ncbi:hypothetical protein [Bradyrhizobium centrosematis]|uniref:hypothetical protein n=1 Tax=Bradyrhizobium centrosematis TaxID=1300039 RepID=UPI002169B366|nr:hypothetical protein [Bradyrhizobium centrosematis]MCS3763137.1 hypothetical protein [Bradyrhizobium centrosematis]MCS3775804.1 hypothetical protein [Bradyrhizobium centrosematis]